MVSVLPAFSTGSGKLVLSICNFLFAAKLKKKSSNSSSAAFGIGVSDMSCSMVSTTAVSFMLSESVGRLSPVSVLFPLQENINAKKAKNAVKIFFILFSE